MEFVVEKTEDILRGEIDRLLTKTSDEGVWGNGRGRETSLRTLLLAYNDLNVPRLAEKRIF